MLARAVAFLILALTWVAPGVASAQQPTGYFVWTRGGEYDAASRKIYRATMPGMTDELQLTFGEDIEAQISPNGRWVAYAKAKLPGGSDYHDFNFWRLYVVSIHGPYDGREENKIDDNGYWPSWGDDGELYYSQVDGNHTNIMRATLDENGRLIRTELALSTRVAFPDVPEVNECFMSPRGDWFAARTRQTPTPGVGAYSISPPDYSHLAQAGSVGCMPVVAPSGDWALIAGSEYGIRWGESPLLSPRLTDQVLIRAKGDDGHVYHPGVSNDEQWAMAAHSNVQQHNDGPYDIYLYTLTGRTAADEQQLTNGGFNGWPNLWVGEPSDPPPPVPVIDAFYPSSYTLVSGEQTELNWTTSFADGAQLDGNDVALVDSSSVAPTATTTYTLIATHSENTLRTATAEVTITVHATAQAVSISSFTLDTERITAGESALLSWSVDNATTLDINGERAAPSGTLAVEPLQTTTYTLSAAGHQGPVTAQVTLTVGELEKPPPALLPDRGGFMCSAGGRAGGVAWSLLLGALALLRLRRRD